MLATIKIGRVELYAQSVAWYKSKIGSIIFSFAIAVFVSALLLSYQKHASRELHTRYQQAANNSHDLQVEWRQLLIEQSMLNSNNRTRRLARNKLAMHLPQLHEIKVV